jgi:flagellar hook-associated protein 2
MNFLGIGSGLELNTMLNSLVQVASEPKVKQLGAKEVEVKDSISGLGTLSSLLSDFQDASDALKDSSLYNNRTATVTQPSGGDVISVTADDDAVTGTFDISVEQLARGTSGYTTSINADHTAALGKTDTLTFSVPDGSSTAFNIAVDATMSLEDIRDAINNADDNFGVKVNVVDGRLTYESSITGDPVNKELQITSASADTDFDILAPSLKSAQQAHLQVDGIDVYSDTNTFDTQISGLSITALKADAGQTAEVDVALDTASVESKINDFASKYNALREGMNALKGSYDDEGNFTPGKLSGDPILRNLESVLSTEITQIGAGVASGSTLNTLYAVGLDIQEDGTLEVDSTRLSSALTDNFDEFDELFSGTQGIGTSISNQLDNYLGLTGIIQGKEDSYNDQLDDIETQYEAHIRYIENYQETLKKQFVALDSTMARMNAVMSQIGPQLAALGGSSSSS